MTNVSPSQRWNAAFIGAKRARALLKHEAFLCRTHYTLRSVLRALDSPMQEFDGVHSVMIEAPTVSQDGFYQQMLKMVTSLMKHVKQLVVIAQPTIRRVAQRSDWIAQWNSENTPFKFYRCCSCALP